MTKTVFQLGNVPDLTRVRATVCVSTSESRKFARNESLGVRSGEDVGVNGSDSEEGSDSDMGDSDSSVASRTSDDGDEIDGVTRAYRLRDDRRVMLFTGVKLSSVSSERPGVQRWTDIDIYRTDAGRYVVNRVGVSVVAHRIDCTQVANKKRYGIDKIMPDECAPADREPCPLCRPDIKDMLESDPASLTFEQDKHRTNIWERVNDMIDSLYTQGTASQRALSGLMLWALDEAAKRDPIIAEAYNRVITIE